MSHREAGKVDEQLSVLTALEGHGLNPQHPPGSLQSSTTPVLGDSMLSFNLHGDCTDVVHVCVLMRAHTHRQSTHKHKNKHK